MTDWRPYDLIAQRYDAIWGRRFEDVARLLWDRVGVSPGAWVLDVGTGTGLVPRALGARAATCRGLVGCDRSLGMLSLALARMPTLCVVAADATRLPLRSASFDVATASFVLSHVPDYRRALAEALRVLKPSGALAVTSWTANTDPCSQAWNDLLAGAISKNAVQEAVAQVAPWEGHFEQAENLEAALAEAGFGAIEVHAVEIECGFSLDLYLADREISTSGRFGRHALGPEGWARLRAGARESLRRAFGERFSYRRAVLIGLGRRE